MDKPTKALFSSEDHLTRLFFNNKKEQDPDKYYVVGAIEWAIGLNPGYALLSAQNVRTGVLWIFEEFPFWTVRTTNGMEKPLWLFFKDVWKKYLCRYFYYSNPKDHARFSQQVQREPLIRSSPVFIEAEYVTHGSKKSSKIDGHESIDNLILEYQRLGKIKIDMDAGDKAIIGNLFDQLSQQKQSVVLDDSEIPGIKALRSLVAGVEKFPYQKPLPPQEIPKSYV
jgi:hypothetical protein